MPNTVNLKYRFAWFFIFAIFYCLFYMVPNMFPIFEPRQLPLLPIDVAMPFLPVTFAIYLSDYVLAILVIFMLTGRSEMHAFARMAFTLLILSGLVFLLFPTTYPRPVYPSVENRFIQLLMDIVRGADTPLNCFPSMHVAITAVCAYAVSHKGKTIAVGFWLWGLTIFVSTLTTKQHYFVDILGGLGVAAFTVLAERTLYQNKQFTARFAPLFSPLEKMLNN
jgi:membrane-associated phospholipid phosphatase